MPDLADDDLRQAVAEAWLRNLPDVLALTDQFVADALARGERHTADRLLDQRWEYVRRGQVAREVLGQS